MAAAVFVVFLLAKLRPVRLGRGRPGLGAGVRAARERAHGATTARARAEALCEAGRLAAEDRRWTASAGFFLRAMRTDPAWSAPVELAAAALARRRPRFLEKLLWRRLAALPWDGAHAAAARVTAARLASIYREQLRDPEKAEVLSRLAHKV